MEAQTSGGGASTGRPLLRHARAAGEVCWRRPRLANQVEVAMLAAGPGAGVEDPLGFHRQLPRGTFELRLLIRVSFALPGYEDTVFVKKRRRQLGERGEAAHRPRGDCVVGLAGVSSCHLLGASVDDGRVGDAGGVYRALDEVALAPYRLDQVYLGCGHGSCQD